ncbi:sensor histidine kinase [Eubacterium sp. AF15-50]|uniref:sensor histidine kinase n=1 Tax=unclassified Eubacterium (in: firmicutes) TaxID=2624479 RepID=UPI00325BB932
MDKIKKADGKNKKGGIRSFREGTVRFDIQSIIMAVLTTLTIITTIIMGLLIYNRFKISAEETSVSGAEDIIDSVVDKIDGDLLEIRQISNVANYNIVQQYDVSDQMLNKEFSLLYEINSDKIQSMALYDTSGKLIAAEPVASEKENAYVKQQDWFSNATDEIENIHFSTPHIQNLFTDGAFKYYRVVSLSRSVDINDGETPVSGVLLIDMKYSIIEEALDRINEDTNGIYYYLCNSDGELIYHPRKVEIDRGIISEESTRIAGYEDGTYELNLNGGRANYIISSIAYTGWKVVGVVPDKIQTISINKFRYYVIITIIFLIMMLLVVNKIVSGKISRPILNLNDSVKSYEAGGKNRIYIGGSSEIRDLGYSVQKSYEQIEDLMKEIIRQQNERRKSEMDALQSQINPHFLYNTLESITWMVEAGKNKEAVFMISELAKLLRISLSKGRTIIKISDELQHSKSYMNIQMVRYKERFKIRFDVDDEINDYCIVKLVIQPILENAIYYGVGDIDIDDGEIVVTGKKINDDIFITVEDNGMGMREEVVENILKDNSKTPKHGSGVGVINVHSRIKLMFGDQYGLSVESEADEGTKVTIHIPAIPFNEENRKNLENQNIGRKDENEKK